jgi:hypothetical protein
LCFNDEYKILERNKVRRSNKKKRQSSGFSLFTEDSELIAKGWHFIDMKRT